MTKTTTRILWLAAALIVAPPCSPAFSQSNPSNPILDIGDASDHVYGDEYAILSLHQQWTLANAQAGDAERASLAALAAAQKCAPDASKLADQADAKLMAARIATVNADTQERALVADAERTVKSLEQRNPSAVRYATFAELQQHQEEIPKVALLARMNLDPGDNPVSGLGLLSDARLNLKQARELIAHCGH